jgi:hypothetical protein
MYVQKRREEINRISYTDTRYFSVFITKSRFNAEIIFSFLNIIFYVADFSSFFKICLQLQLIVKNLILYSNNIIQRNK